MQQEAHPAGLPYLGAQDPRALPLLLPARPRPPSAMHWHLHPRRPVTAECVVTQFLSTFMLALGPGHQSQTWEGPRAQRVSLFFLSPVFDSAGDGTQALHILGELCTTELHPSARAGLLLKVGKATLWTRALSKLGLLWV